MGKHAVVHYQSDSNIGKHFRRGGRMRIVPLDHPSVLVTNGHPAITSPVTKFCRKTGVFYTLNTKYVPK